MISIYANHNTNKETICNAIHIEPQPTINQRSKEIVKSLVDTKHKLIKGRQISHSSSRILLESKKKPKKTLDEFVYMSILLKEKKLKRIREHEGD